MSFLRQVFFLLRIMSFSLFSIFLVGCVKVTTLNEEVAHIAALKKRGVGTAIMKLSVDGWPQGNGQIGIGVSKGRHYRLIKRVDIAWGDNMPFYFLSAVTLPAGQYHIVAMKCSSSGSVSQGSWNVWEKNKHGAFLKSYASFTVKVGEVVNVGKLALRFPSTPLNEAVLVPVGLRVTEQTLAGLYALRKDKPSIYASMVKRHMTLQVKETMGAASHTVDVDDLKPPDTDYKN